MLERRDADSAQPLAADLQTLYTKHVITERMAALWNNGFGDMSTVVEDGLQPAIERGDLVRSFTECIVKTLLVVDSHPTLSRFFTFRECVDKMLAMIIID